MANDQKESVIQEVHVPKLTTESVITADDLAPVIYTDGPFWFNVKDGVLSLSFGVFTFTAGPDGKGEGRNRTVLHLKMSPQAAAMTRDAIDKAFLAAVPVAGGAEAN